MSTKEKKYFKKLCEEATKICTAEVGIYCPKIANHESNCPKSYNRLSRCEDITAKHWEKFLMRKEINK